MVAGFDFRTLRGLVITSTGVGFTSTVSIRMALVLVLLLVDSILGKNGGFFFNLRDFATLARGF